MAGIVGVASAFMLHATGALDRAQGAEGASQLPQAEAPALPSSDDLFAIKLQVRDSDSALLKELERAGLAHLIEITRDWNTDDTLQLHGGLSLDGMPYFAPMPRSGHEHAFQQLVPDVLGDLQLHLFPFTSQQEVERIAASCGLSGTAPISKWSTWRPSGSRAQINHCSSDGLGMCALLTRGCLDGTFQED